MPWKPIYTVHSDCDAIRAPFDAPRRKHPWGAASRHAVEKSRRNGLTVVLGFVAQPFVKESVMSDNVYKVVEIVGSSKIGTDDAIRNAIETSAQTIRHISWFEVIKTTGHVVDGKVGHFQVTLKIGFRIEAD
jgi:dodecin